MKNMITFLVMVLTTCLIASCEKEADTGVSVDFEFRLLNSEGEPSTLFEKDEDIIFSFLIINNSKESLYLEAISDMDDFFEVFDLGSRQENGELLSMGKPYSATYCTFVNGYVIPARDTLKVELPWVPRLNDQGDYTPILCNYKYDNQHLSQGTYTTGFSSDFSIANGDDSYTIKNKSFTVNFKVE